MSEQCSVVAGSGHVRPSDKRLCVEAGFELHFTKPVDFAGLEQLLSLTHGLRRLQQEFEHQLFPQDAAVIGFIGAAMEIANTMLDFATVTKDWQTRKTMS